MKSKWINRIFALFMTAVLFTGDVLPAMAETVSGGDAPEEITEALDTDTDITEPSTGDTEKEEPAVEETADSTESAEEPGEAEPDNSVSDGNAENNGTVSAGNAEENVENEEEPSEDSPIMILEPVTVDGVTITVSGSREAFEEGTIVCAAVAAPAETVVEAAEEKEQASVIKYKAFDISLMLNGESVQPLNGEEIKVNFEGDVLIPGSCEDIAVYHVDEEEQVTRMPAEIAPLTVEDEVVAEQTVEMTTTHFSTYMIVVTEVISERKVTFKHYLGTPDERTEIYAPSELTVANEEFLKSELPVQGGNNYTVDCLIVKSDGKEDISYKNNPEDPEEIEINLTGTENIIEIYYTENDQVYSNEVTFFDYYIDDVRTVETYIDTNISQNSMIDSFSFDGNVYENYKVKSKGQTESILQQWRDGYSEPGTWQWIPAEYVGTPITVKDGDVLYNVKVGSAEYGQVIFKDGKFCTKETEEQAYSFDAGINAEAVPGEPFLAMGLSNYHKTAQTGAPWDVTSNTEFTITKDGRQYNFNTNNATQNTGETAIMPGLVERLEGSQYETLVMGKADGGKTIREPGYFTGETSNNKAIYENYSLVFNQAGNNYVLDYVQNNLNGNKTYSYYNERLNNLFLPLNDVEPIGGRETYQPAWADFDVKNNYYFAMRCDFTFSIGDYIGPMTYEFAGDDDLWVFVDGRPMLDLGGLHSAYPDRYSYTPDDNKVDLWQKMFGFDTEKENWWEALTEEQKSEEHQVTILYMERGGYESSCAMKFVIPNVETKTPVVSRIPRAELELLKKDSESREAIAGVGFTLYRDADCTIAMGREVFTDEAGKVKFSGLKAGTYYLKETTFNTAAYEMNSTVYTVTVTADSDYATAVLDGAEKEGSAYVIYNTPVKEIDPPTEFAFKKIDSESKNPISGVTFKLYNTLDAAMTEAYAQAVSDRNGNVVFTELTEGTYLLAESPNPGYCEAGPWILEVKKQDGTYSETLYGAQLNTDRTAYEQGAEYNLRLEGERVIENTPERGALKITKTVDRVETVHGAASFTFKIEGPEGMVLYRTITFEEDTAQEATKSVTITNLPAGSYTVTELDALRYECITEKEQTREVTAEKTPEFVYKNKKIFENYYSHTDNVVNQVSFIRDGEGNITGSVITREKTSCDEAKEQ